jgi:hypothetical protein
MEAELTVAFLAYTERYTSRVTCVPYESVRVRSSSLVVTFFFLLIKHAGCCGVVDTAVQNARDDLVFPAYDVVARRHRADPPLA